MKTLKIATIATIITLALIALCGIATAELYPATARVISVDMDADLVTVETFTGYTYAFDGVEDWTEGDCCSLIMEDNGTDLVYDDAIIKAQYGGWGLVNWYEGE